jgi:hypothetical protein
LHRIDNCVVSATVPVSLIAFGQNIDIISVQVSTNKLASATHPKLRTLAADQKPMGIECIANAPAAISLEDQDGTNRRHPVNVKVIEVDVACQLLPRNRGSAFTADGST